MGNLLRVIFLSGLLTMGCAPVSGGALEKAADLALPSATLAAAELEMQFRGQTALGVDADGKGEVVRYFAKNGRLRQVRDGFQQSGKWFVRDDGRLCVDLKGEEKDCRIIVRSGKEFQQYAVKLDGNHRHELTYRTFARGDQLEKLSRDPVLPLGTLDRKELKELFSGKTVESSTVGRGRASRTYYAPDGRVEQLQEGVPRSGSWRVRRDGRICLQMEDRQEKCRIVVREKNSYRKYIVKKNGKHQPSVNYGAFLPGRQL